MKFSTISDICTQWYDAFLTTIERADVPETRCVHQSQPEFLRHVIAVATKHDKKTRYIKSWKVADSFEPGQFLDPNTVTCQPPKLLVLLATEDDISNFLEATLKSNDCVSECSNRLLFATKNTCRVAKAFSSNRIQRVDDHVKKFNLTAKLVMSNLSPVNF